MKLKNALSAILVAGSLLAAGSASATVFNPFTVDPSGSGFGPAFAPFTADKITGNYNETITFTSASTFDITLTWSAGQFVTNSGNTPLASATTGLGSLGGYALNADFSGTGTFATVSGITTFSLAPGGALNVYLNSSPTTTVGGTLIGTGVSTAGLGTLDPALSTCSAGGGQGINCGSFGQTTTLALNAVGSSFFVLPSPFYNISFQSGQLNNFPLSGTQSINGSMDVVFSTVPEPATIALFGLALLGLGFTQRRKS